MSLPNQIKTICRGRPGGLRRAVSRRGSAPPSPRGPAGGQVHGKLWGGRHPRYLCNPRPASVGHPGKGCLRKQRRSLCEGTFGFIRARSPGKGQTQRGNQERKEAAQKQILRASADLAAGKTVSILRERQRCASHSPGREQERAGIPGDSIRVTFRPGDLLRANPDWSGPEENVGPWLRLFKVICEYVQNVMTSYI